MILSSVVAAVLGASAVVYAAPHLEARGKTSRNRLYARAEVKSTDASGLDIEARLEFWGGEGRGTFVKVEVLSGLWDNSPALGEGHFAYHVHTNPVGKERNCTKALGHLDPLNVTESLICDPAFPKFCQEGDLSGKHGKLNGTSTGAIETFGYTDDYLRYFPEDFSLLGRSVVIHSANKTRIACGDIISTLDGTANGQLKPTYKPSKFVKNYPTAPPFNPPQVVTPFVGTDLPSDDVLHNLPFPLPFPAIPIKNATNVKLTTATVQAFVNGTEVTVTQFQEEISHDKAPFKGFKDNSWIF